MNADGRSPAGAPCQPPTGRAHRPASGDGEGIEPAANGPRVRPTGRALDRRPRPVPERRHLSGRNLVDADLQDANLSRANLFDANLEGADLLNADLDDANLFNANLHGAFLLDANLSRADLFNANLQDANLEGADLHGARLQDADLHGANLHNADLSRADLSRANLHGADLLGSAAQPASRTPQPADRGAASSPPKLCHPPSSPPKCPGVPGRGRLHRRSGFVSRRRRLSRYLRRRRSGAVRAGLLLRCRSRAANRGRLRLRRRSPLGACASESRASGR